MADNINVKGSHKFSDNPIIESLTRSHPATILTVHISISLFLLYYFYMYVWSSLPVLVGIFFSGIFVWTFTEYMMHRYVYHFITQNKWIKKMHYVMHGHHHDYPRDKSRLVLPLVPSLLLAVIFFGLFWLLVGNYAFAFYPGFVVGYLGYAMIHYSIHSYKPPKSLHYVWKHHNIHHFQENDRAFGVSNPFWDLVFRTMPREYYGKKRNDKN